MLLVQCRQRKGELLHYINPSLHIENCHEKVLALIPKEKQHVLTNFLAQADDFGDRAAPEANAYEFQSGGVVEMLEKLADKFQDERNDLMKAETNSKHAYDMLMQDLAAQIEHNTQAREEKSAARAAKLQRASDAKGDRIHTTATRDADPKFLGDLNATCAQKGTDFESSQLLEGMAAKGKEEKHAEQVQFAAFKQFCDDTSVEKQRAIKEVGLFVDSIRAVE
jgi:hypothetical protein